MKKTVYAILAAAMMLVAVDAGAQVGKRYYVNIGWQLNATPSNAVAASGLQGWGAYAEGGYYLTPKLAIGGFASFNTNEEYIPRQTYVHSDREAITTDAVHSLYQVPFGATLRYRFSRYEWEPYIEAKIGANYAGEYEYFSTFYSYANNWGFYASPEIGVTWHPFKRSNFGFQIAAYYSYASNRSDVFGMNGINNAGIKIGLSF